MSTRRLRGRVPSAEAVSVACLHGYVLRHHKRSKDRSGKANALFTDRERDVVYGVVFRIEPVEKGILDKVEGLGFGYDETTVAVRDNHGQIRHATMYVANPEYIDDHLVPYDWYKDYVLQGAREHNLPAAYVRSIEAWQSKADPDSKRAEANRS